jgi:hypothetical protein
MPLARIALRNLELRQNDLVSGCESRPSESGKANGTFVVKNLRYSTGPVAVAP